MPRKNATETKKVAEKAIKKNSIHTIILGLVVLTLISTICITPFLIKKTLTAQKVAEVGGIENYKLLQELQNSDGFKNYWKNIIIQQYIQIGEIDKLKTELTKLGGEENEKILQSLQQMEEQAQNQGQEENGPKLDDIKQKLSEQIQTAGETQKEVIKQALENGFWEGNKKGNLVLLVYSDMHCPYCKREITTNQTQEKLLEKYPNLRRSFRNYVVHSSAQKLAEGLECIGKKYGDKAFFDTMKKLYNLPNNKYASLEDLYSVAKDSKFNEKYLKECIENGEMQNIVKQQQQNGFQAFKIQGTPGNVLYNLDTNKYIVLGGAYPEEYFEAAIDLLNQK